MSENALIDIRSNYTRATKLEPLGKKIPRNFFQTYKTSLFDYSHAYEIKEFRSLHPTFNFYFYDDDDMENFMSRFWGDHPIYQIFKGVKFGAAKADIWRYCILYTIGGIYLDIDSKILFNLESLDSDWNELISFEENIISGFSWNSDWPSRDFFLKNNFYEIGLLRPKNIVLQWLLAFRPGHPILFRTIELIVENSNYYLNREFDNVLHAVVSFSGPIVFTQAVWEYVQAGNKLKQTDVDFNKMAIFKSIPDPLKSIYIKDDNYYARLKNRKIFEI